jgi:hypothetical protein
MRPVRRGAAFGPVPTQAAGPAGWIGRRRRPASQLLLRRGGLSQAGNAAVSAVSRPQGVSGHGCDAGLCHAGRRRRDGACRIISASAAERWRAGGNGGCGPSPPAGSGKRLRLPSCRPSNHPASQRRCLIVSPAAPKTALSPCCGFSPRSPAEPLRCRLSDGRQRPAEDARRWLAAAVLPSAGRQQGAPA